MMATILARFHFFGTRFVFFSNFELDMIFWLPLAGVAAAFIGLAIDVIKSSFGYFLLSSIVASK